MKKGIVPFLLILLFSFILFMCDKIDCPPITSAKLDSIIVKKVVDTIRTLKDTTVTLTLQPNSAAGKDATIWYIDDQTTSKGPTNTSNYGSDPELPGMEWTFGIPKDDTTTLAIGSKRGLIEFDLSSIPSNSSVSSAYLSLYGCPTCSDPGHAVNDGYYPGTNQGLVQRITTPWTENTVTWNTSPSITTQNQDTLPPSTSTGENYTNINVTALVQDMINNPSSSYGFMISMQETLIYRRLIFASSDNTDSTKHPKIVVTYKYQYTTITIK